MSPFANFNPNLIVEATTVCDRACAGCYAPNLVTNQSPASLFSSNPELFLDSMALAATLARLKLPKSSIISIRGGEPTRHPLLNDIISKCLQYGEEVIVETHGRWLLPENLRDYKALVKTLSESKAAVKISFDRMHGLTAESLRYMTDFFTHYYVSYYVAITESSDADFNITRSQCDWIQDDKIIRQSKVNTRGELIRPQFGVVGIDGSVQVQPTAKKDFRPASARPVLALVRGTT